MKLSKNLTTGTLTNAVKDAIRYSHNVYAVPRVTVDWNLNRYTVPSAFNTPDEDLYGFDIESFPIDSIIEPVRPGNKGILKARVNEAVVSSTYQQPDDPKFYTGDPQDVYKYWTSPVRTDNSGNFPMWTDGLSVARPRVEYNEVVKANKIVIRVDNTWARPNSYSVHTRSTVGGGWSSAIGGGTPAFNLSTGVLTLYYNGTAWVTTRPTTLVTTNVAGIEFRVNSLTTGIKRNGQPMTYTKARYTNYDSWGTLDNFTTDGSESSLNVISIEAHYETDLTDRLMSVSDEFDMSEKNQLYPIGTVTSNQADITFSNEDGIFNRDNTQSPYYGLLEPNAEINLEYIYTINGVKHSVQQFKMYSETWAHSDGTITVSLEDGSKYLKAIKPRPIFYENKPVTEIIWRVLDSVGFNDYEIGEEDTVIEHVVPFFWTTGEQTVWEVLDSLSTATQTAIYFDSYGKLQVRTRGAAYNTTKQTDWGLRGEGSGQTLSDIVDGGLTLSEEYEANKIAVKYKATKWKVGTSGKPAMSKVWEPDGEAVVVRSSPLIRTLVSNQDILYLDQKEVIIWPYKSKVQINGEIIQYDGKEFVYYTGSSGGTKNIVIVKSEDEYNVYNKKTLPQNRAANHFTGGLKITERAVWNTQQGTHYVDANMYTTKQELRGSRFAAMSTGVRGFTFNRSQSTVTIHTPNSFVNADDTFWVNRGGPGTGYKHYGTRLRFTPDKTASDQRAGIAFYQSNNESGYYVELGLTGTLSAAARKYRNEVAISAKTGKTWTIISKGVPTGIAQNVWYELDIYITQIGGQDRISVWVNGQLCAEGSTTNENKAAETGKFSMFARGRTNVSFEYLYALNRPHLGKPDNEYGYFDLLYGGVRGGAWEREYVWETRTRWKKRTKKKWTKEEYRYNNYVFDEFGAYVHEVREFDVKFDPAPVQYSYLFNTNEWYSAVVEYSADPFGARFVIANTGRNHAVLKGEDNLIYGGTSKAVSQVLAVLGRELEIADEETVLKENIAAIRARGPIEAELSSDWIQSKTMATDIAEWMSQHWSDGVDELTVEIFGNPLLEIGDVVTVDAPLEHMDETTHKYFVTGTSNDFDGGLSTTLTLRRVR